MILACFDQARSSGFAIVETRDPGVPMRSLVGPENVLLFGVARTFQQRAAAMDVLRSAVERRSLSWRADVYAVFEDHSKVPARKGRSTATSLGMGAARGAWDEQLSQLGVPKGHRLKVPVHMWRSAVLGLRPSTPGEDAKRRAVTYVAACTRVQEVQHDAAEAFCIGLYAANWVPSKIEHDRLVRQARRAR